MAIVVPIGQVVETSTAMTISAAKSRAIGTVFETNVALPVTPVKEVVPEKRDLTPPKSRLRHLADWVLRSAINTIVREVVERLIDTLFRRPSASPSSKPDEVARHAA